MEPSKHTRRFMQAGCLLLISVCLLAKAANADAPGAAYFGPQQGIAEGHFGSAVDAAGNLLVIGAPGPPAGGGTAFVMQRNSIPALRDELRPADVELGDLYGASVGTTGSWIAVGSPGHNGGRGRVVVWKQGATVSDWTIDSVLEIANHPTGAALGACLDMIEIGSVLYLAAGAPGRDEIRVFDRQSSGWSTANQTIFGGTSFGTSVALGSTPTGILRVAVGEPGNSSVQGKVETFAKDVSGWSIESTLSDSSGHPGDGFGASVGMFQDDLIVGAPGANGGKGAVVFFEHAGGTGTSWNAQFQRIAGGAGDALGRAVTMFRIPGSTLPSAAALAGDGSHAIYFLKVLNSWGLSPDLIPSSAVDGEQQGGGIALTYEATQPVVLLGGPLAPHNSVVEAGVLYQFDLSTNGWSELPKFQGVNLNAGDNFAASVAVENHLYAIGAPGDDQSASDGGAVYVFRGMSQSGQTWSSPSEKEKLTAGADSLSGADLGVSVSVSEGRIAGGAPGERSSSISFVGAVYVFAEDTNGWFQETRLAPTDPAVFAEFGKSVSFSSGELLAVGAPGARDPNGFQTGGAYIYRDGTSGFALEAKLSPPGGFAGNFGWFGSSISADETRIVVGAPLRNGGQFESGEAFVYVYDSTSGFWSLEDTLAPPTPEQYGNFGEAVAIQGNHIAVGEPDNNFLTSGRVHLFERTLGGWQYRAEILPSDGEVGDNFGAGLDLDGEALIVGSPNSGVLTSGGFKSGSAYLYQVTPAAITETCVSPSVTATQAAGRSVALDDDACVLGAPFSNPGLGAAYKGAGVVGFVDFPDLSGPEIYCFAEPDTAGCQPWIDYSGAPSISASTPFVLSAGNCLNNKSGILMYSLTGRKELPWFGKTLCIQPPVGRTKIQFTGGSQGPPDCSGSLLWDVHAWIASGNDPNLAPGVTLYAQFRYRDPAASGGLNVSNAIEVPFTP